MAKAPQVQLTPGITTNDVGTRQPWHPVLDLVDIAALAESPGPLERYAEAAAKQYRSVQRDPSLDQAILLASLMSVRVLEATRTALDAQPPDEVRISSISKVLKLLTSRGGSRRALGVPESSRTPQQAQPPYRPDYRFPLVDEVLAAPTPAGYKRRWESRCQGRKRWNPAWASLYLIALRLAGMPSEGVVQVRLNGQDLVAVRSERDVLCIYAHALLRPGRLNLAGAEATVRLFNDVMSAEFTLGGHCTRTCRPPLEDVVPSRSLMDSWVSRLEEHARDRARRESGQGLGQLTGPGNQASKVDSQDAGQLSVLSEGRSIPVGELAHQIRREVFHRSAAAPGSVYTLACYAHQTLLVDRPEAYGLASLMSPAARALARRCGSPDAVLQWMRRNLADRSIFAEPDRLMLPDQVIKFRRGRALDRALLIFATTRFMGMHARVIQTTRGVYVLVHHLGRTGLIDADRMRWADSAEGVLALAFDAERTFGLRDAWSIPARNAA